MNLKILATVRQHQFVQFLAANLNEQNKSRQSYMN